MANEHDKPEGEKPRIIIDSDWKAQVEAEKEALRKKEQERASGGHSTPREEMPMPPASFPLLVTTLASQVVVALGQAPHPASGKQEVRLEEARHFIDMLGMLEEKTKGNLTPDEADMLEQVLHELRMLFVAVQSRQ